MIEVSGEGAGSVPLDETHLVVRTMFRAWAELGARTARPGCTSRATTRSRTAGGWARRRRPSSPASPPPRPSSRWPGASRRRASTSPSPTTSPARLEGHPDNASASVFGGATLSWTDDRGRRDPHRPAAAAPRRRAGRLRPGRAAVDGEGPLGPARGGAARRRGRELGPRGPARPRARRRPGIPPGGHPRVAAPGAAALLLCRRPWRWSTTSGTPGTPR